MRKRLKALLLAAGLAAAPALAQPVPPPPPVPVGPMVIHRFNSNILGDLSPEGRRILSSAMRDSGMRAEDRQALDASRDRLLRLLQAEKLDVGAVRRTMAEERELADRQQRRRQEVMLDAFRQLSVVDRRAFAGGMRDQKERIARAKRDFEERMRMVERRALGRSERAMARAQRAEQEAQRAALRARND